MKHPEGAIHQRTQTRAPSGSTRTNHTRGRGEGGGQGHVGWSCLGRAGEGGAGVVQCSLTMGMMMYGCWMWSRHRLPRTGLAAKMPCRGPPTMAKARQYKMVHWGVTLAAQQAPLPAPPRHRYQLRLDQPCEWQPAVLPPRGQPSPHNDAIQNHPWEVVGFHRSCAGRLAGSSTALPGESLPQSLNCRMHPCCHHALAHAQAAGP